MSADEERSRVMRAVGSKDTKVEMTVRRLLFSMGYRYRLHKKDLPGKPDIVFQGRRKVIFVHGCFWHGHQCARGNRLPKSNSDYWRKKIAGNISRDNKNLALLREAGWDVLFVWECETKDTDDLKAQLRAFVESSK